MDTPTLLPVQYRDSSTTPWPRILRIIGLFTLIYSAAKLALTARTVRSFWGFLSVSSRISRPSYLWLLSIHLLLEFVVAFLMILGAVQLFRHGSARFILIACRLVIGFWLFAVAIGWTFERTESYATILLNQLLYGGDTCIFPLLLLLLLQAWQKDATLRPSAPLPA